MQGISILLLWLLPVVHLLVQKGQDGPGPLRDLLFQLLAFLLLLEQLVSDVKCSKHSLSVGSGQAGTFLYLTKLLVHVLGKGLKIGIIGVATDHIPLTRYVDYQRLFSHKPSPKFKETKPKLIVGGS